jgi:hypothetical protein
VAASRWKIRLRSCGTSATEDRPTEHAEPGRKIVRLIEAALASSASVKRHRHRQVSVLEHTGAFPLHYSGKSLRE